MVLFNEKETVEKPTVAFFQERLGYRYVPSGEMKALREGEGQYIVEPLFLEAVGRINGIDEKKARDVLAVLKSVDTNCEFLEKMRNGVQVFNREKGQNETVRIVDYGNADGNDFVVTDQFYFSGDIYNGIPDVAVVVNGIVVSLIELKSPVSDRANYQTGVEQIERYERELKKLFIPNCFNMASDGHRAVYGVAGGDFVFWKDEEKRREYSREHDMTLHALFSKELFLDLIRNFIVFVHDKETNEIKKKMARYQQYRAANKIVARVVKGEKHQGLIWHTQGSGKSLTMFFAAWKLRYHPKLENPRVFILVDRIDLNNQILDTFNNAVGPDVVNIRSGAELAEKVRSDDRGIFVTTIQKFRALKLSDRDDRSNLIVFSDEAHRSDEGAYGLSMRWAFQNGFYFGFTGTPIDRKHLNTFRNYEGEGRRYLDYYSIVQAIEDDMTVPVRYESRLSQYAVDAAGLDERFNEITAGVSEEKKEVLKSRYGTKSTFVKMPERIEQIVKDIQRHYEGVIAPNGFKAQVVAVDKETVALYKKAFDRHFGREASAVVISADKDTDSDEVRQYHRTKQQQDNIVRDFKIKNNPLKFLIVCDMLLTGFDAPIEQVMYLDKPLRDHNLLQAIARTNRTHKNKTAGLIIDYYGVLTNLRDALDFDESDIAGVMTNLSEEKRKFAELLDETLAVFERFDREDASPETMRSILLMLKDNYRKLEYFRKNYLQLKDLFELISPDPFLRERGRDRSFRWLTKIYIGYSNEVEDIPEVSEMRRFGEKIKRMIREEGLIKHIGMFASSEVREVGELYIGMREHDGEKSDIEKVLEKEIELKREIEVDIESIPEFVSFGERLERIKDELNQKQIDEVQALAEYEKLSEDIRKVRKDIEQSGLDRGAYGVYVVLKGYTDADDERLVQCAEHIYRWVRENLDTGWQITGRREQHIRGLKQHTQELLLGKYRGMVTRKQVLGVINRVSDCIIKTRK